MSAPVGTTSAPGTLTASEALLAAKISVLSLLDPALTEQVRPGLARSTCPHCGDRGSLFATERDYRCDSCDAGGDVVALQMAMHRVPYRTAVATLAVRAELAPSIEAWTQRVTDAQYAMDCAAKFYHAQFEASPTVQAYWIARGFERALARQEGVGYAPRDSAAFFAAMREAKVSNSGLFDAGLVRMSKGGDGKIHPFFRDRLLFPIRDTDDLHTVAFGGRIMVVPEDPAIAARTPKYLNSPNSVLWQKAATLMGLGAARDAMRKTKAVIVVEGYFTRLRLLTAGIPAVVATCGTSLTAHHAQLLALTLRDPDSQERCTAAIFYDDGAESRALAAAQQVGTAGIDAEIVSVPAGCDDADTLGREQGLGAVLSCIEQAVPPWEFCWRRAGGGDEPLRQESLIAALDAFGQITDLLLASRSRYARKEGTDFLAHRFRTERPRMVEYLNARRTPPKGPVRGKPVKA